MKLRAPRCRDSIFLMSVPDGSKGISPSSASALAAQSSPITIKTEALSMTSDPFRHRLHAVVLRVPGHQQKESKIQNRAYPRQHRVDPRGRFQAANAQGDE